jgi:hypothetical protein
MNLNFNVGGLNMFQTTQGAGAVTSTADAKGQATKTGKGSEEVRHELVDGDYQIIVHIIEARDLKPVDTENGTADPVVVAKLEFPSSVIPQYQNTDRKVNTLNPVWDYTMIFRQTGLPASEAKMAILSLMVKDANITQKDVMIGQFDFNLDMIYSRKNHEYFQQWCALMDPTGESEEQQGYLRVNITVLIGADEMASHTEEEVQGEKFNVEYGVTSFRDVLMPPHVIQGKSVVCAEIIRGDGMVPLDLSAAIGLGGIDPYVQLQFGNQEPVKSSYIAGTREPVWNQQLEVPVIWPTMIDMVTLSIWDHDMAGTDDAVGALRLSFKSLMSTLPGTSGPPVIRDFFPNWFNFYGAPPEADYTSGVSSALVAYAMNHGGRPGTFFRGRLLMRIWKRIDLGAERRSYDLPIDGTVTTVYKDVVTETKSDDLRKFVSEKKETRRFDDMDLGEIAYKEITETRYTLRCDLYEASDMSLDNTGFLGKDVQIQIRVGKIEANSKSKSVNDGRALFNEAMDDLELMFPEIKAGDEKNSQFPDIFIYLVRGGKHIAYIRWTAVELLDLSKKKLDDKDYMPKWLTFIEEPCIDFFAPGDIPGFLLCSVTMGKDEVMAKAGRGGKLVERVEQTYEMRFHLYMARFLPAKDENGLCDPYCVVKYYGQSLKSSVKMETCNPSWYETVVADVVVPEPLELAPPITVLVYDEDKFSKDDLIGRFYMPLTKSMLVGGATPPMPEWKRLAFEYEGDVQGEVLASITMVPAGKKGDAPPPDLLPATVDATVELSVVGLRDMTPVPLIGTLGTALGLGNMGIPLASPYLEIDMGDANTRQDTKVSSYPSANDPNYLETYSVNMKLPKNELFAPTMTLRVRDIRSLPGGYVLGKPLVATGTVGLSDKLPWAKSFKPIEFPKGLFEDHGLRVSADADDAEKTKATKKAHKSMAARALAASKRMVEKMGDFLDDGEIDTPKYMIGRKTIDNELEDTYKYPNPIMEFPLFRGCDGLLTREQPCGKFKGYVRVMQKGVPPPVLPIDMAELFMEKRVVVRLYLLKAYNLPPMDLNGSTDSYPVIKLAGKTVDDKDATVALNLNPNYYTSYELYATIPGACNLEVTLMDADTLSNDTIGSTYIDLENRYFNVEWREYDLKPVETRTLHLPTSSMSCGKVSMWVEIMTPNEAASLPMIDIKPPPPEEFELRVIVWNTKNVPMRNKDGETKVDMKVKVNFIGYESVQSETGIGATNNRWDYAQSYGELMGMMTKNVERMGDLARDKLIAARNALGVSANPGYVKETDVHWYVTNGRGDFNYRMVWPLLYNVDKIEDKPMRLSIGVYDFDLGKDDLIGECNLDIQPLLKRAFQHRERNRFLQVGQPFRLLEGAVKDWRLEFDIKKDNHTQGEVEVSIEVMDHMVGLLKPAGEGRDAPNTNPCLPEPLRRMPWEEQPMISSSVGGCCGSGTPANTNMAA